MAARLRCSVSTSGVVSAPPRLPPSASVTPSVPMVPQGMPSAFSAAAIHCVVDVLPLVPVTAITVRASDGRPYHRWAISPSSAARFSTSRTGTAAGEG